MNLLKELHKTKHHIRRYHTPHQEHAPILRADGLGLHYESGPALDDVSFELRAGQRVAVVGPNGAGKSTLFKIIAGVLKPTHGQIHVHGSAPDGHICIAYVPQRSQVDWDFPVNVRDVVMMGRVGKMGLFRQRRAYDAQIVQQALEVVNLAHLARRQIGELSGGQQQRMFIARALAQEAELMLMDEPLTGLDVGSQEDIFEIMESLRQRDVTIMVALHDLKLAAERFELVMLLNHQLLGFGPPAQVFEPETLTQAYGGHLHLQTTPNGIPFDQAHGVLVVTDTCCDEGTARHA